MERLALIDYRLALTEVGGTEILHDVFGSTGIPSSFALTFTDVLNDKGSCDFSLPIISDAVTKTNFAPGKREIHVFREEVEVWAGRLWTADMSAQNVRFMAGGWPSLFNRMIIDNDFVFVGVDQFEIIDTVLDYLQSRTGGDFGFDLTPTSGSTSRTLAVCLEQGKSFESLLDDLSPVLDWWVTPDKTIHLAPWRGTDSGITLDATLQIATMGYQLDAQELVTQVLAYADHADCEIPGIDFPYAATDTTARGDYGLLQAVVSGSHDDPSLLEATADEELNIRATPRWQPTISVPGVIDDHDWADYQTGDVLQVVSTLGPADGFGQLDVPMRITTKQTVVTKPGMETVNLTLDSRTAP